MHEYAINVMPRLGRRELNAWFAASTGERIRQIITGDECPSWMIDPGLALCDVEWSVARDFRAGSSPAQCSASWLEIWSRAHIWQRAGRDHDGRTARCAEYRPPNSERNHKGKTSVLTVLAGTPAPCSTATPVKRLSVAAFTTPLPTHARKRPERLCSLPALFATA
jgi:hypothetical protein